MNRRGVWMVSVAWLATGLAIVASDVRAAEETPVGPDAGVPKYAYVGAASCRMCHRSKKRGEQFKVWRNSKHPKAFEALKTPKAAKVAKAKGLAKPAYESPECLKCHATGWDLTGEQKAKFLKSKFKIEDGVQCETCHGAGNKYKSLRVMKNRELAVKKGMVMGDEKLCRRCHNEQAPSWDPQRFTTKDGKKAGFDYEAAWDRIKHPAPRK